LEIVDIRWDGNGLQEERVWLVIIYGWPAYDRTGTTTGSRRTPQIYTFDRTLPF
jgi:hypothetical protein